MHYLQARMAPLVVDIEGVGTYEVPKLTIDDLDSLGNDLLEKRVTTVTAGLNDAQKREYLTLYPQDPPDYHSIKKYLLAPGGAKSVCSKQFKKAKWVGPMGKDVPLEDGVIDKMLTSGNSIGRVLSLAWALADMDDRSETNPRNKDREPEQDPTKQPGGGT